MKKILTALLVASIPTVALGEAPKLGQPLAESTTTASNVPVNKQVQIDMGFWSASGNPNSISELTHMQGRQTFFPGPDGSMSGKNIILMPNGQYCFVLLSDIDCR